jgi:ribosomal protein S18 acetylase RimI-like enzyme
MSISRTLRAIRPSDLEALLATAQAADVALWGQAETDLDDLSHDLELMAPLERNSRVAVVEGRIAGFVLLRGAECVLTLHPDPPQVTRAEVAATLLRWALQAGARELDVAEPDGELRRVATLLGCRHTHRSYELMRRTSTPVGALPAGVRLEPFRPGVHAPQVHRMLYAFWAETPTHHDRPYDQWRALFIDPAGSDPEHQVVAWQDGEVVGAAICRVFTGDTGWILQLGVARPARGRGLGRALLGTAADRLAAAGVREVGLSVDATNETALSLYRSTGFVLERTYLRLECQPQTPRSNE